jgi:Cd2+/Zn2+-exporting ATPase
MNNSLQYECDHDEGKRIEEEVRSLTAREEPEAVIVSKGHKHLHSHDHAEHGHHHEHHHGHEKEHTDTELTRKYRITGLDCADCAASLERKLAQINGVRNLSVSYINSLLVFECDDADLEQIEKAIIDCAAHEEPDAVIEKTGTGRTVSYTYRIANIDCADCAEKLARRTSEIRGVAGAQADYMRETLTFECMPRDQKRIEKEMIEMIGRLEPEVVVTAAEEQPEAAAEIKEDNSDRVMLMRLAAGAVLFIAGLFVSGTAQIILSLAAWLVLGYDVLLKAVRGIGRGQVFDEHFLMAVATIAAIYLKDYREAAGVMLFYQIGEYFQDMAVRRSRKSIGELMDIRPDYAFVKDGGEYIQVSPDEVSPGEIIRVKPGEKIPLDGVIVNGASCLNTSSLTGESRLQDVDVNDSVISGAVNETGVLEIRVTKEYGESTVSRILELVENADSSKAKQEKFITKFSRWYTPLVVLSAVLTAIAVSVIYGDINEGIRRACTFLVISCPCALVISIPLSFFAGIGGLSGKGILVKGANVIETLANVSQAVFDKTGTLTTGEFSVEKTVGTETPEQALRDAAYAEYFSSHPLAEGIRRSYAGSIDEKKIANVRDIAGRGLSVTVDGDEILAGNYKLMKENGIECEKVTEAGSLVYVARNGVYEGCLVLNDSMKEEAVSAVSELHAKGTRCIIVSGDNQELADKVGQKAGADEVHGHCLPEDKVRLVSEFCKKGTTVFVGDGVNDAPVLAAADAGFAMGVLGSDAAIEAADVVIMDDSLKKIPLTLRAASRIIRVASENIYGAIGIKLLILILGAFGIANMWMAIFADTGVAMLCVLNSMRLLRIAE